MTPPTTTTPPPSDLFDWTHLGGGVYKKDSWLWCEACQRYYKISSDYMGGCPTCGD